MSSTAISNYFGSDSTGGGIGFQFRAIKKDADRQRACFDSGGDPKDLGIGSGKGQSLVTDYFTQHITFSLVLHKQTTLIDEQSRDGKVYWQ